MKRTKDPLARYFSQKSWSTPEWICLGIMALLVVIWIIGTAADWYMNYLVFPPLAVALAAMIVLKTGKVGDAEMERTLQKWVAETLPEEENASTVAAYDLCGAPVRKGGDGKVRSPAYVTSHFGKIGEVTRLTVRRFDLPTHNVAESVYDLAPEDIVVLRERVLPVPGGRKTVGQLVCEGKGLSIPVVPDDLETITLIEKFCQLKRETVTD